MVDEKIKDKVKSSLINGVVVIEFIKADGSLRQMQATLNSSEIDQEGYEKQKDRVVSEDLQVVWDVEKQAWRSFVWDRLETLNGINVTVLKG